MDPLFMTKRLQSEGVAGQEEGEPETGEAVSSSRRKGPIGARQEHPKPGWLEARELRVSASSRQETLQVLGLGAVYRLQRYSAVQSEQASLVMHRQGQQVGVGQLAVPEQVPGIEDIALHQAQHVRPEIVVSAGAQGL